MALHLRSNHSRDRISILNRLGCLDHRQQQGLLVEHLADFGLRNRGIAELWPAAESRAVAFWRIETGFDNCPGLGCILDMRHHDPLGTAIEDAGRVVRVVRGDPGDRRDAHAQCRDAHPGAVSSEVGLCSRSICFALTA
jgi:hypothetical protein